MNSIRLRSFAFGALASLVVLTAIASILYETDTIALVSNKPLNIYEKTLHYVDYTTVAENLKTSYFISDSDAYFPVKVISAALNEPVKYDSETFSIYVGIFKNLKRADFDTLKPGMTQDEVEAIVGKPHRPNPNFNRYLPTYYLENGELVTLDYTLENGSNILRAIYY